MNWRTVFLGLLILGFCGLYLNAPARAFNQIGYLVPLYSYPTSGTWTTLINDRNANPSVPVIAIVNINSGPGVGTNPDYVTGINNLKANGIRVLGYVDTDYGAISTGTVEGQIDQWKNTYGVDGIFLDRMDNVLGAHETYYSTITTYAKSTDGLTIVFGNPGTTTVASYIGTVDVIISYENGGLPSASTVQAATTAVGGTRSQWAIIAFSVSNVPDMNYFNSVSPYISWVFVTDRIGPPPNTNNPYSLLPTYENAELINLANVVTPPITTGGASQRACTIGVNWVKPHVDPRGLELVTLIGLSFAIGAKIIGYY